MAIMKWAAFITVNWYVRYEPLYLYFSNNQLTNLPKLPESLKYLDCANNQLTSLPNLPESLINLYCDNNQLTSLPNLPESLINLYCVSNNLPYEITLDNFRDHNNRLKLLNRSTTIKKLLNDNQ